MPHFYASGRSGERVEILGADARHLAGPLRARPGERIAVVDPAGFLLTVELDAVSGSTVTGHVVASRPHRPEPRARVTMAVAMLPAATLDLVLSRCTELGAAGFVLIQADRSIARGEKPDRWATICREAAMLAGRAAVPSVRGPLPFRQLLDSAAGLLVLDGSASTPLSAAHASASELTLAIGPEGGWSESERELAAGRLAGLGPRVLRADTAAAAALAVALAGRGELG